MRWLALLLMFTGCFGNLSNDDLRFGTVLGQLTGSEAAQARVFLLNHPDLATTTDSAGRFSIPKVPEDDHNPYQLLAIGTTTALTASVEVEGGQLAAPSTVALMGASPMAVSVSLRGAPLAGVEVSVEQTPISATTGSDGVAALGVLPAGRFRMSAARDGVTQECSVDLVPPMEAHCEIGFEVPVDAGPVDAGPPDAGPDDAGPGDAGPADAGPDDAGPGDAGSSCTQECQQGLVCDPADGQCYLCVDDDDCGGGGAMCSDHSCISPINSCQSCQSATDCASGACLPVFPEGGSQCVASCNADGGCGQTQSDYGYSSNPQNLCLPNTNEISTCDGALYLGASCNASSDCVAMGLVLGLCVGAPTGSCSVACASDSDCPLGWLCQPDNLTCHSQAH